MRRSTMKNEQMALLFSEATPYIQKYHGKTLVIKYGGNAMVNDDLKLAVMNDLVTLTLLGVRVVLVHGGGPAINSMLKKVGKESKFVGGLRYTDEETMGIVQQVLAGQVNKDLVALLKGRGVGLCGMDGHMIMCKRKSDVDLGYVGEIEKVNTTLIDHLLADSFIPVIATVGMDDNGVPYNINADTAAAEIAIALHAEKLVSMTDIVGLLYDKNDESTLIPEVEVSEIEGYKAAGVIAGGMLPKIEGMADAIYQGVHEAVIIDGRVPHSILLEMFSDRGAGTMFYRRGNRSMASPSGEAQTVKKLHSCLFACVGATIGRLSTCRSNAFSGSLGFPLGGSCQRPRPLTDEGEVLGAVPQTGSRRTLAPHPACGHLPPRGKAPRRAAFPRRGRLLRMIKRGSPN